MWIRKDHNHKHYKADIEIQTIYAPMKTASFIHNIIRKQISSQIIRHRMWCSHNNRSSIEMFINPNNINPNNINPNNTSPNNINPNKCSSAR